MSLTAALALLLQIGPNPHAPSDPPDAILQDRPPRDAKEESASPMSASPMSERRNLWLSQCFDLLESDPARAHVQAQIRRDSTTGQERIAANHCLGLAASAIERWDEARAAFVAARDETPADERRYRARVGAMAANAAFVSGDARGALGLGDIAIDDARAAGDTNLLGLALIDRARFLVALARPAEALGMLDEARALLPQSGEAFLLSATLLRRMDRLEEAARMIAEASALAPEDPGVGIEAGLIAALTGRDEEARGKWQSVVARAPQSQEADTARFYLDQLDQTGEPK